MIDYAYSGLFTADNVDKQWRIEFDGGVIANSEIFSGSVSLTESLCSGSELRFGCCEASTLKLKVASIYKTLHGQWLTVKIILNHHEDDPFIVGKYKVQSDELTADRMWREITAYDAMYDIINADVAEWYKSILPEENSTMSLRQFRESFVRNFGLEEVVPAGGLINDSMTVERTVEPEQMSGLDVISAICEINGCFGHIGRDGKFQYIYLPQNIQGLYPADDLYPDHAPDYLPQAKTGHLYPQNPKGILIGKDGHYIEANWEDFITREITKLQIRQEDDDIGLIYGDGDNCYIIEDNFLVYGKSSSQLQNIAANIFSKISEIVYRPFDCDVVGDPCLEVGDPIRLPTKYEIVESYILERTLSGGQARKDAYRAGGVKEYAEKVNSVHKSIVQLKGKSNVLTRTIEETRVEMRDADAALSHTISITAKGLEENIKNTKEGLETQISATAGQIRTEITNEVNGLNSTISQTAKDIRTEVSETYETKTGAQTQYNNLSSSISQTAKDIRTEVSETYETKTDASAEYGSIRSSITQTANSIKSEVAETYETKTGAQAQYNSLNSSISQTAKEISTEVSRATAAEGNLSSQIQQIAGQIVLKADANGRMVQVALNARPETGSEFKVDADNINLSANDVMNLMAGGTLNLSAMNISISSNNFSVDSQGNVVCNNLSAVTFTGRAIDDLNDAIWNSETMRRVNEIIAIFDGKIGDIEQLLYNNKVLFDTLDGRADEYSWHDASLEEGATVVDGNWMKSPPGTMLKQYTVVDATGYNKIVCRVRGYINGDISGPHVANHLFVSIGITNDPDAAMVVMHKADAEGGGGYSGGAVDAWFDATFDISGYTSKVDLPINVFFSRQASASGEWRLYCSRITLTNQ